MHAMSEAMSSVEIEDVLSSIRRLVSEDLRPAARPVAVAKAEDKLILTPALRVVAEVPLVLTPLPRLHLGAEPVIEELVASLEVAVEQQGLDWESEVGDPAPQSVERPVSVDPAPFWAEEDPEEEFVRAEDAPQAIAEPDPVWADQAEAEILAGLGTPEPVEDSLFADETDEMSFDEATLRDLVRDILREELHGGLGERITRNVRKLVRSEIARTLAAREFD